MPGLVPGIHVFGRGGQGVDGRVKPGHDDRVIYRGLSVKLIRVTGPSHARFSARG